MVKSLIKVKLKKEIKFIKSKPVAGKLIIMLQAK